MSRVPYCVIGIDPGTTTGIGILSGDLAFGVETEFWTRVGLQIGPARGWDGEFGIASKVALLVSEHVPDMVCIEDFVLRSSGQMQGVGGRDGLSPVRITALIMGQIRGFGGRVVFQSASNAKNVVNDERLRAQGCWVKGQEHARDALRHAILGVKTARVQGNS